jgi:basic membrane lipoprotein Med (substrate-binding protein (PBP1-ABC) superfamily)
MSSAYVRSFARGLMPKLSTQFYETVNEEVTPSDQLWMTLSFDAYSKELNTYCRSTTEYGVINLVYFSDPGLGDSAALTALEADAAVFYSQSDSSGRLVFTNCSAPEEVSNGRDYVVSISVTYEFYTT